MKTTAYRCKSGVMSREIRSTKSETNSNVRKGNVQNASFVSCFLRSNISTCFGFRASTRRGRRRTRLGRGRRGRVVDPVIRHDDRERLAHPALQRLVRHVTLVLEDP